MCERLPRSPPPTHHALRMWLVLGISASVSGALLGVWSRARARAPLAEAVRRSSIAELDEGRFCVRGRIVPVETETSALDGARCVFVERVEVVAGGLVRALEHARVSHRFFLEDETGRLEVDPSRVHIETTTLVDDAGGVAERRLRAGEEVELVSEIRASQGDAGGSLDTVYRHASPRFQIDYDAPGSPPILRDTIDVATLDLDARPLRRAAGGALGAALVGWGLALLFAGGSPLP